ncbi:MAG: hypothetical protein AAB851_03645 [Patescibacteria group bacterium]
MQLLTTNYSLQTNTGFIALISVIIIGAVAVSAATSLLLLGIGSSKTGFALEQSNQAKALANACAEQALEIIRENPSYSGTGGLTLGRGTCSYAVIDLGGQNKTINASGTVGSIIRKVKINTNQIAPVINIASWRELADF